MRSDLELINKVLEKMPNKYEAMIVAAKRARELNAGSRPLIPSDAAKPTTMALIEIADGAVVAGIKPREIMPVEIDKRELLPSTELALEDLDSETEDLIASEIPEIQVVDEDLDDFDDDDINFDHIEIDDSFEENLDDDNLDDDNLDEKE
ncbi:MAG: DNA-directed RNA polymerase subunit omega [Candidatus Poribacteria bacterium]